MPVISVHVDVRSAVGTFTAIRQALAPPMAPPMVAAFQKVADRQDAYVMRRFDRVSQSGGVGEWAPLKPRTVAEKKRKGYPPQILVRTRRLRASLQPGDPDHVRQALPNGVRTGSREKKLK